MHGVQPLFPLRPLSAKVAGPARVSDAPAKTCQVCRRRRKKNEVLFPHGKPFVSNSSRKCATLFLPSLMKDWTTDTFKQYTGWEKTILYESIINILNYHTFFWRQTSIAGFFFGVSFCSICNLGFVKLNLLAKGRRVKRPIIQSDCALGQLCTSA